MPVCPLCNVPIPVKRGEIPDVVVGEHMDRDCAFHPGRNQKKVRAGLGLAHALTHTLTHNIVLLLLLLYYTHALPCLFYVVLGIEPRTQYLLGKHSSD